MIRSGLVSVTFRRLRPAEIVRLVHQAHLECIEWGGDVHVPHGDISAAREVARMTADAGLSVAAYGSYYRVGETDPDEFARVLETACVLGAPTLRVWAGKRASRDADMPYRARVVADARRIADVAVAAQPALTISFEYHGQTLTDTLESALALLDEVQHPAMRSYWQPPVGMHTDEAVTGLRTLLPWLTHVHVFQWWPTQERHPLASGEDAWLQYLRVVQQAVGEHSALLEFVKDDDPGQFLQDALTLRRWLSKGVITSPN
jgi:sugar phosphate isomerase/epimerase